ncbi:MAG: D-aminoacyl-tRNA deacylase [Thermoplasmata archaeon]
MSPTGLAPGMAPLLVVVSEPDPVASRVVEHWGTPPSTGEFVDGAAVRQLAEGVLLLRRPGPHISDEHLDQKLPASLQAERPSLLFPSIHRGEQNIRCLTVHPLGNFGPSADVGGRPRTVVLTDPPRMAAALRRLAEAGGSVGLPATFESTHHGPELGLPAFFMEIGYGTDPAPPPEAVGVLAATIRSLEVVPGDRIAMAVGGGHYAPHFTDLVLRRRWAFGHIVSRHSLQDLDRATAEAAYRETPGAEGLVFARAADADHPALGGLGPRLRETAAPARGGNDAPPTRDGRSTSRT